MDLYSGDYHFYDFGEAVRRGERRQKDLKPVIKVGVDAKVWPGDVDFSELRSGFEVVRWKAMELLMVYSQEFDAEWEARCRGNNGLRH
jgi:hypothetical protein